MEKTQQISQTVKVGLAKFNKSHPEFKKIYNQIVTNQRKSGILDYYMWEFSLTLLKKKDLAGWDKVFDIMIQNDCERMEMIGKNFQPILKNIVTPVFNKLESLSLTECMINSIQQLAYLNAPQLKQLDLAQNRITSLSPINKSFFPQLQTLLVYQNQLRLFELNYLPQNLIVIFSLRNGYPTWPAIQLQSLTVLAKANSKSFFSNKLQDYFERIVENKVIQVFRTKYTLKKEINE